MKKWASIFLTMVFAVAFSSSAHALAVSGLFNDGTATLLSDNSAEFLIDTNSSGSIDVGDILVAMVGLNTIGSTTIGSGTNYNELTAITAIQITSDPVAVYSTGQTNGALDSIQIGVQYTAMALDAADSVYFNWATGEISLLGNGTVDYTFTTQAGLSNDGVQFGLVYEDAAKNYDRSGTIQDGLDSATDGTYRLAIGLDETNGDVVNVNAPTSLVYFSPLYLENLEQVSGSSIYLDGTILDENWAELDFNDNITGGNGGFAMPEASSEWPVYDNLDFTLTANVVPEPGTVVLLGVGMLGLGWTFRRR